MRYYYQTNMPCETQFDHQLIYFNTAFPNWGSATPPEVIVTQRVIENSMINNKLNLPKSSNFKN